jgi:hypothetical protein
MVRTVTVCVAALRVSVLAVTVPREGWAKAAIMPGKRIAVREEIDERAQETASPSPSPDYENSRRTLPCRTVRAGASYKHILQPGVCE